MCCVIIGWVCKICVLLFWAGPGGQGHVDWAKQPGLSVVGSGDTGDALKPSRSREERQEHLCAREGSFCYREGLSPLRG